MKEVYLIPGLGADRRVFQYLNLAEHSISHISWIEPLPNESIEQYAGRLTEQIKSPDPILVGVSFGGMIAVEIAKQIKTNKIILISSARTQHEIPLHFKLLGRTGIQNILPASWWKRPNRLLYYFFGIQTVQERALLSEILRDTDSRFLKWALHQIVHWKNELVPENAVLIHGSADRLFPNSQADVTIPGGGHFMIVNRAAEISTQLKQIL
ncbi:MAG TPA: alpha/beta hydrolase [Cyclobacteriaceae bacterium]|nr:alpha/beta hydrolase [Cyclobacteriaceae bacterium]HMV08277.1 alpha/beta hydrolase [Cyclobacteriaceae bacterium]HMV90281.1 alpha/beta hydrolase [Cyclobacteriaceae bacterium]HMX02120.1 alpha/beta hydrolase [Cyclobacteriaceae bacterium]HMX49904.1 alpha/beta hydrolase [Cyclobacteriaceae bacterium]